MTAGRAPLRYRLLAGAPVLALGACAILPVAYGTGKAQDAGLQDPVADRPAFPAAESAAVPETMLTPAGQETVTSPASRSDQTPQPSPSPSPTPHPFPTPRPLPTLGSGLATWRVETWAGQDATGSLDGPRLGATFEELAGLAMGADGALYLSDHKGRNLRRIGSDGVVTTLLGPDRLNGPRGIALAPSGTLYGCESDRHRVLALEPGGEARVVAGGAGIGSVDGPPDVARFDGPCGVAVRPDGRVVVGSAFPLHGPNSVAVKPDGQVLVLERQMGRLSLLAPDQSVTTVAGGGYPTYADGTGASAGFSEPSKICLAPDGRVFVGDAGDHRVRVVEPDGRVWTLAGDGPVGFTGGSFADGTGATARFNRPMGIALGKDGALFVADSGNHRIRRLVPPSP
ncbi:MAG: hypothetical protein VKO64_02230 [Candidatus Sericytochromatia bacterium]|nr:hypothetical protein [Candidatus Sericytochromatia bacterium]